MTTVLPEAHESISKIKQYEYVGEEQEEDKSEEPVKKVKKEKKKKGEAEVEAVVVPEPVKEIIPLE